MVDDKENVSLEELINDCILKTGYDATKAFADLNRYISKLRKQYKESQE